MWIKFDSFHPFKIKIHVGGINAVSGTDAADVIVLSEEENANNTQDYIVAGKQYWLDGIATGNGNVGQFVAERAGSGYSVEAQMTGSESVNGIQFEIIPRMPSNKLEGYFYIKSADHLPDTRCRISGQESMYSYFRKWVHKHGVPLDTYRF